MSQLPQFISQLLVTDTNTLLILPMEIRNALIRDAQYRWINNISHDDIDNYPDIINYIIYLRRDTDVTVSDTLYNRALLLRDITNNNANNNTDHYHNIVSRLNMITISCTHNPNISLSSGNVNQVIADIRYKILMLSSLGYQSYQITIHDINNNMYINSRCDDNMLSDMLERYDSHCSISSITVRGTNKSLRPINIIAGSNDGIPVKLGDGFWTVDMITTKKYCILYAIVQWKRYIRGISITDVNGIKSDARNILVNNHYIKNSNYVYCSMFNTRTYYVYDTEVINPDDTIKICCIHVSASNHVSLIVHEKHLLQEDYKWIEYKTRTTFIQPIHNKYPKDNSIIMFTLDIECYRNTSKLPIVKHQPLLIGIYNGSTYKYWNGKRCIQYCLDFLSRFTCNIHIFVHNGGKYDFHLMLPYLMLISNKDVDQPIKCADVNNVIISLDVVTLCGTLLFRDSYRLISSSLKDITVSFDVKHVKQVIDVVNATRDDIMLMHEYNMYDCMGLYEVLIKFRDICLSKSWDNPLQYSTISSFTKHLFYSRFYNSDKYPLYVLPKWMHIYLKQWYHGGRCEVFHRGRIDVECRAYDINSCYPYAGLTDLPYGKPLYITGIRGVLWSIWSDQHSDRCCFVKVAVTKDPHIRYPLHGILDNGKYIFPYLNNATIIYATDEELNYGLTLGYEYNIIEMVTFDRAPYMREYFSQLYNLKVSSTGGERDVWKTSMNASYGWFGFNKYDRNIMSIYHQKYLQYIQELNDIGMCEYSCQNDMIIVNSTNDILVRDTNISVASYITSRARLQLHRLMMHVDNLGYRVFYCDTDSIYTDANLQDLVSNNIGALKLEAVCTTLIPVTSKVIILIYDNGKYCLKIKGINIKKIVLNNGNIIGTNNNYISYMCSKIIESINNNNYILSIVSKFNKNRTNKLYGKYIHEVIQQISLSLLYDKRIINDDGTTKPLTF